jgi:hypothetical protein
MRDQPIEAKRHSQYRLHAAAVRDRWIVTALGASGLILGVPYALSAGFVYDDWYLVSHQILGAPSTGVYVGLGSELALAVQGVLFRADAHLYYVAAAVIFSLAVVALYVALRALNLDQMCALIASALLLAFPAADSLRLWDSANLTLALAALLATLGITAGSRWVENDGRAYLWLATSLLLWAAAIFCYFSVVVLMLLPIALIPLSSNRRRTLLNFGMNLVVGVVCLAIILPSSLTAQYHANWALSAYPGRALAVWIAGYQFLVVGPFGRVTVVALAAGLIAGCLAAFSPIILGRNRQSSPSAHAHVGRHLATAGLLIVGTLAAWTPLIPANAYYTPSTLGVGNRVNGFAQIFLLTAVAVLVTTAAGLAGRLFRQPVLATATAAGLALVLLASSLPQTIADAEDYTHAATIRTGILTLVANLTSAPSTGTTVLLGDYNAYDTVNWIPVFASTYDFNGALQILYNDPRLFGYLMLPGFSCTSDGLGGIPNAASAVPYRRLIVIDVGRRRTVDLTSLATCTALLPKLLVRLYPS